MTLLAFVARRVAAAAVTLFAVAVLLFAGSEVLPGDAAAATLGPGAGAADLARRRAELGLDHPWPERFVRWVAGAAHLDLGSSLTSGQPVLSVVTGPLGATALLVAVTAAVTVPLATALGLLTGLRPGSRLDRLVSAVAVGVVSVPQFVTAGLLVLLFADLLPVLPAITLLPLGQTPADRPEVLVLPATALTLFGACWAARIVRAAVVDADARPHVEAARLAGLPEATVIRRHLFPGVVVTCAPTFAWLVSGLFGGTAVVEQVFGYPGLSQPLVAAVRTHDTAVLEGIGLVLAAIILAAFVLSDLVVALVADPRARAGAR